MTTPRLTPVVSDRTDVGLATVFERVWRMQGCQTHVRFHGPGVHMDAVGKTSEDAKRETRVWTTSTGAITVGKTSAFVRRCECADAEPYMTAIGGDRVAPGAHRPGLVVLGVPAIAVEVHETDIKSFVHDLAAEGNGASDGEGGGLGSEGDDDDVEDPEDDETDENDTADRLTRREALAKTGTYVASGLVAYLTVKHVSDVVQQSPELRATVAHRVAWLDARLPDVRLPPVEWSVPMPQPLSEESILPSRTAAVSMPANATAIPYADLRERPETCMGTTVTHAGRIEEAMERDGVRLALVAVKDDRRRFSDDVIARWPTGRFSDSDIGFWPLTGERVWLWGVVAGGGSISNGVRYPHIDMSVLEKTWVSRLRGGRDRWWLLECGARTKWPMTTASLRTELGTRWCRVLWVPRPHN